MTAGFRMFWSSNHFNKKLFQALNITSQVGSTKYVSYLTKISELEICCPIKATPRIFKQIKKNALHMRIWASRMHTILLCCNRHKFRFLFWLFGSATESFLGREPAGQIKIPVPRYCNTRSWIRISLLRTDCFVNMRIITDRH